MSQPSDNPEEDSDFQDLEETLARLKPTAPSDAFSRQLNRQFEVMESERAEKSVVWVRFAPVAAAACVVLTSAFLYKEHLIQKRAEDPADGPFTAAPAPGPGPAPVIIDNPYVSGSYLPVSQQHLFRGAESGGIIGTRDDGIPLREYRLEFDDTSHWYNPETETNLRIFIPRDEVIRVPVPID